MREVKLFWCETTLTDEELSEALNNLIGVDSAYYKGDKDVDAIIEVIVAAKKLEQDVTRLAQEKDALIKNYAQCMKDYAREIFDEIENMMYKLLNDKLYIAADMMVGITELKKKYVEDKV